MRHTVGTLTISPGARVARRSGLLDVSPMVSLTLSILEAMDASSFLLSIKYTFLL